MTNNGNWFDNLFISARDAFRASNLIKRVLYFFFFAFWLALAKLIENFDLVGMKGGGFVGFMKAAGSSMYYGIGIGLASVWSLITQASLYIENSAWGSLVFGGIIVLFVLGVFYQPCSLIVNLLDFQGRKDTGNKSGNATSFIIRATVTIFVVLVLSASLYYTGTSESILSNYRDGEGPSDTQDSPTNKTDHNQTSTEPADEIINSIDMLRGDTS